MFNNIGTSEILIVAVLVLVFFGGKKLPELAKGLGEAIREFKESAKDGDTTKDKKNK